jgi:hypothetical protein
MSRWLATGKRKQHPGVAASRPLAPDEVEVTDQEDATLFRPRIFAEADAGVLPRLLGGLQSPNIVASRVVAELISADEPVIHIDVGGTPQSRVVRMTVKFEQLPCVLSGYWHRT